MAIELSSLLRPELLATFDIVRPPGDLPEPCASFQANATSLPIRDSSIEIVTALDVIEHIPDDRRVLSEIFRVLSAGGHVVISVPTPAYRRFFGRRFHDSLGHVRDGYTKDSLVSAMTHSGFETVLLRGHTGIGFLLLAFPYYRWLRYQVFLAAIAVALSKPLVFLDRLLPSPTWGGLIAVGRKPAA
jgi:SAM-dependent methyltransferase